MRRQFPILLREEYLFIEVIPYRVFSPLMKDVIVFVINAERTFPSARSVVSNVNSRASKVQDKDLSSSKVYRQSSPIPVSDEASKSVVSV